MQPINPEATPAITLEKVKTQFTHWRQTRSKMTPIPESLWDNVFSLIPHYKTSQILSVLDITRVQFRKAHAKRNSLLTPKQAPSHFIEISNKVLTTEPSVSKTNYNTTINVEIKNNDGITLTINALPTVHLKQLFDAFYGDH